MTDMNERNDHGRLDDNLDRLLKLGEPPPRMPEGLKSRIRSKLIEMGPESGRRNIFSGRWAAWPLAAATVLAVFFIVFWPGGSPNTISWADVQKHLEQIRTLVVRGYIEVTTTRGIKTTECGKAYHMDPGLLRIELYDSDADLDTVEPEAESIVIIKYEPGLINQLTLYPDSKRAEWATRIFRINGQVPSSQPFFDGVSESLEVVKKITSDKANRIGDRVINDTPAMGFRFDVPAQELGLPTTDLVGQVRGEMWVRRDDGLPIVSETEFQNARGDKIREKVSEMRWNVPLDESLFDQAVPAGWDLNRTRSELNEYTGTVLAPGVTLEISPDGQQPLAAAGDVAGVIQVTRTPRPGSVLSEKMQITIDLKPAAAKRLHDYAGAHPDKIFIADFNGQTKVAVKLDASHPTQISINLNRLHLSLAELETKYFTTSIERNKK